MGRAQSVSNPHFTTPSNTDGYTTYAYDDLGRKLYQCQPDNGTGSGSCVPGSSYQRWQYSGNVTTITDEVGKSTQQTADALGRLTQVVEPGSLVTNYSYDALNNLLTVKQLGNAANGDIQRTRSFSYDSLSRLLTTFNPETGSVSYVYDANGNVVFKTSPAVNGASGTQTIGYCYDVLNRITYKFYSAPPSNCTNPTGYAASFTYDSSPISGASNTAGRLTEEQSFAGGTRVSDRKPYAYDSMGRLLRELQYTYAKMNSGTPYSPAYTYDLAGNLLTSTDGTTPSPTTPGATLTFTNVLDGAGRLSTVTSNWSDPLHPLTLFSAQTGETPPCANSSSAPYAASGGLQNAAFGIGSANVSALTLKRAYDSRLRTNCEIDW
jgi:YD repeat-containing protein